jgi:Holliday junction resolvase RusA-like endonuclease
VREVSKRHVATLEVKGQPASYSTAATEPWKEAVRAAVRRVTGVQSPSDVDGRFDVRIEFRLAQARTANEVWDLDNLIKPTLDAMEGIFGLRPWKGQPQAADDRVDRIEALKRPTGEGESPGAGSTSGKSRLQTRPLDPQIGGDNLRGLTVGVCRAQPRRLRARPATLSAARWAQCGLTRRRMTTSAP